MKFPINLSSYKPVILDLQQEKLSSEQKKQLQTNIQLVRDSIVFFTAYAGARGLGGHTGGPYDIVPEVLLADGFMRNKNNNVMPIFWDEAGHRVAIQYIMSALDQQNKAITPETLLHYREHGFGLYGHPERDEKLGIKFSSGRLGHMWSFVNGVALAHPDKKIILFGSDGSQQEGNDAEAARCCVAQQLKIVLTIDDNNITISGHPNEYMKGYDLKKTLEGHGLSVDQGDPENLESLYTRMRTAILSKKPAVLLNKRKMAVGIEGIEDSHKAHDVVAADVAIKYLEKHGYSEAVAMLKSAVKVKDATTSYLGSSKEVATNRSEFGKIICNILRQMPTEQRKKTVKVFDCDLDGSTGLKVIKDQFSDIYVEGGVMERNNFSAAAGFGYDNDKQGIFATFSAFLEMVVSEITMSRLNHSNVLAHFSHAGVDWMADNTCHYGINNFFADNGIPEHDNTRLYFPADALQMKAMLEKIFFEKGLRFIFSTRSSVPFILDEKGNQLFKNYIFTGKDDLIREGKQGYIKQGYIVSYGDMLYRCLDAVEQLKQQGISMGLINKNTLNVIDEAMMKKLSNASFILVVESQNIKTGLGIRFGTWLLQQGFKGNYDHLGTHKLGAGGIYEHIPYQGLDSESVVKKVKEMVK
ncbi:transketolase [Candidatus Woesearchaeota archaeon]|nr:transketolase [Candidatus Woesearchaeota archaeon]